MDFYTFDADYVRRLKDRDPSTQNHFVSYFTPRLQMKLRHRGLVTHVVEDICQETFFRVLSAVEGGTIVSPEKFGAFVNAVCDRVVLEKYRESSRHQHLDVESMEIPDGGANLETAFLRRERRKIVAQVLDELSPKKRNILRALLYEQLDREQMCQRFGVNSEYLRVLVFRAKEDFALLLKAKGLDQHR